MVGCKQCGNCCRVIHFPLIEPDRHYVEFLEARGVGVNLILHENLGTMLWGSVPYPCPKLIDGKCSIYDTKPAVCDRFPFDELTAKGFKCPFYEEGNHE